MTSRLRGISHRFKTNYQPGDRPSARDLNLIGRLLNGARGERGIRVALNENGLVVSRIADADISTPVTFRTTYSNDKLIVAGGFIHIAGREALWVEPVTAADDVELDGGPYLVAQAWMKWHDYSERGINLQEVAVWPDDIPHDDDTFMRWPLFAWQFDPDNDNHVPIFRLWEHDIHIGTAL